MEQRVAKALFQNDGSLNFISRGKPETSASVPYLLYAIIKQKPDLTLKSSYYFASNTVEFAMMLWLYYIVLEPNRLNVSFF